MEYCKIKFRFLLVLAFFGLCLTIPAPNPVVNRRSGARPNFEPETRVYMAAVSIPYNGAVYYGGTAYQVTGKSLWNVVNSYVLGLKSIGWTKFVGVYLYIGGTSVSNSKNLINTATFSLTFNGGVSHGGYGVSFSSAAYARTGITPLARLGLNSCHISSGCSSGPANYYYAGVSSGGNSYLLGRAAFTASASVDNYANSLFCNISVNPKTGDYVLFRNNSSAINLAYGSALTGSCSVVSGALSSQAIQINGYNNNGTSTSANVVVHNVETIGLGLTSSEALSLLYLNRSFKYRLNR